MSELGLAQTLGSDRVQQALKEAKCVGAENPATQLRLSQPSNGWCACVGTLLPRMCSSKAHQLMTCLHYKVRESSTHLMQLKTDGKGRLEI